MRVTQRRFLNKKPLLKEEVNVDTFRLSSSRMQVITRITPTAGIGTVTLVWLPRLHRAGPSASLDKSMCYLVFKFIAWAMSFTVYTIGAVDVSRLKPKNQQNCCPKIGFYSAGLRVRKEQALAK